MLRKCWDYEAGSDVYKEYWKLKKSYKALVQKKKWFHQVKHAADVEILSLKKTWGYWQFRTKQKQCTTPPAVWLDIDGFKNYYMR